MKRCGSAAAMLVLAAGAMAQDHRVSDRGHVASGRNAGSVYISLATGERVVNGVSSRHGGGLWSNSDTYTVNDSSLFHMMDGVVQDDGRAQYNSMVVDWGDIDFGAHIDGVTIAYGVSDTIASPFTDPGSPDYGKVPGLNILYAVWNNENGQHDGSVNRPQLAALLTVTDAYGAVDDRNVWQITIDLAGAAEFDLRGDDQDGDGKLDFGYGYSFRQRQHVDPRNGPGLARGVAGPLLVLPGNAGGEGEPPSFGVEDALDWYNSFDAQFQFSNNAWRLDPSRSLSRSNYVNTYFFEGETYGSYFTKLYGHFENSGCIADFNGDGFIDFFDYLDFVQCFEEGQCPVGQDPDVNGDDFVDFFDYSDYVTAFEAGC